MHFYGPTDVHVFMKTSNRIADSKREDLLVRETRKAIWQEFWWISENFFQFIFRFVNFSSFEIPTFASWWELCDATDNQNSS